MNRAEFYKYIYYKVSFLKILSVREERGLAVLLLLDVNLVLPFPLSIGCAPDTASTAWTMSDCRDHSFDKVNGNTQLSIKFISKRNNGGLGRVLRKDVLELSMYGEYKCLLRLSPHHSRAFVWGFRQRFPSY